MKHQTETVKNSATTMSASASATVYRSPEPKLVVGEVVYFLRRYSSANVVLAFNTLTRSLTYMLTSTDSGWKIEHIGRKRKDVVSGVTIIGNPTNAAWLSQSESDALFGHSERIVTGSKC